MFLLVTHGAEDMNFLRPPTGKLKEVRPKKVAFYPLFHPHACVFFGGEGVVAGGVVVKDRPLVRTS